ncbi:MAG: c-type cytochrome [Dehalococcoidia bacterium]|nr:c-type cytochrome [Dehalococcoidia bacterium]
MFADEYADIRHQLTLCFTCHGQNGVSTQPKYPIIAGQHFYYLYVQLKDFKSGYRASEIMGPMAKLLGKNQMKALAKFFSEQKWPNIGYRPIEERDQLGETSAASGQCVQCHLGGYEGDSRIPRLAGQYPEYLHNTMLDFKNKIRNNSPAKGSLLMSYSDDEIAAMAEYLAGKIIYAAQINLEVQ